MIWSELSLVTKNLSRTIFQTPIMSICFIKVSESQPQRMTLEICSMIWWLMFVVIVQTGESHRLIKMTQDPALWSPQTDNTKRDLHFVTVFCKLSGSGGGGLEGGRGSSVYPFPSPPFPQTIQLKLLLSSVCQLCMKVVRREGGKRAHRICGASRLQKIIAFPSSC